MNEFSDQPETPMTSIDVPVSTISGINRMEPSKKEEIYRRIIPPELIELFHLPPDLKDDAGRSLVEINAPDGSSSAEMSLYHVFGFRDPILYGQITDTINGQLHVLLYVLNDPQSPRFDVDVLPDGEPTQFGTLGRNLEAERAALAAGLAPGQIRRGVRMLGEAIQAFDRFAIDLGHDIYFAEPLFYHTATHFERYGFTYVRGHKLMEEIHLGFSPGGSLLPRLDGSTPFRQPGAERSIRLRSWAIHDGILGEPFDGLTMYKRIDKHAGVETAPGVSW